MSTLSDIDVRAAVSASLMETFGSMLSMEIRPVEDEPPPGQGIRRMVGTLHFAGNVTGILNVHLTFDFGRLMASALLGMEPEEGDSGTEGRKLVAEITNIVGGHLKSALHDGGYPCALCTPSITCGTDFSMKSPDMDRFDRYAFRTDDHVLIIEVGLKEQESGDSAIDFGSPGGVSHPPHVDLQKLDALDYRRRLADAAVDVFDTMFSLTLERMGSVAASGIEGIRCISSVGFAGDATGMVSLHVGRELSCLMAANMLGMTPEAVEGTSEIEDMLGKLGNIVGGNLLSALTDTGLRCALSTPSVTIGSDVQIESVDLEHVERLGFRHESRLVLVEMGLKLSEPANAVPSAGRQIHPRAEESRAPARRDAPGSDGPAAPGAAPPKPQPPLTPPAAPPPLFPAQPVSSGTPDSPPASEDLGLDLLLDIPVELTVELGRTKMPIHELLKLQPGSAVKLARLEGEPVDILANDVLIARGEVVVRHEKYGIRITEITRRMDRLRGLK